MKKFRKNFVCSLVIIVLQFAFFEAVSQNSNMQNTVLQLYNNSVMANSEFVKNCALSDTSISLKYLTGKFNVVNDRAFTECDPEYALPGIFLQEKAYIAFIKMFYAAKYDSVNLKIVSGFRSFDLQQILWEQKWTGSLPVDGKNLAQTVKDPVERARIILTYSSMPGTSRHHWGTDVDLNSTEDEYFETNEGKKTYQWLCTHASRYGFCQPFNRLGEDRKTGYNEEKWHWSYMPLAKIFLEEYKKKVSYKDISGFAGSQTAKELKVIDDYVMSINKSCE